MSGKALIDQIRHYQKDIERCPENSERMIRCIKRLYVLPILVQHLQETGVGRSVNALRKYNGEVGEAAKALVAKWKAMVAAEESSDGEPEVQVVNEETENIIREERKLTTPSQNEKLSSSKHQREEENVKKNHSSKFEHKHEKKDSEKSNIKERRYSNHSKETERIKHNAVKESSSRKRRKSDPSPDKKKEGSKRSKVEKSPVASGDGSSEEDDISRNGDLSSDENERSQRGETSNEHSELEDDEYSKDDDSEERDESDDKEESEEEDSSSSSDHHKSKTKHSSRHKSSHSYKSKSSHSSKRSTSREKHHYYHKKKSSRHREQRGDRHSKLPSSSSKGLEKLIKENEKKIKKEYEEKETEGHRKSKKDKDKVRVKVEKNEDGSIDAGSGVSFAEALMDVDVASSSKKKKKSTSHSKKPDSIEESRSSKTKSSSKSRKSKDTSSKSKSPSRNKEKSSSKKLHSSPDSSDLTKVPELLSKPIKLETLPLDISSTLPEISPNYKPLPHYSQPVQSRRLSKSKEEEAMSSIMTTKYQRTKVYSGNKCTTNPIVSSLYELCIQLLYDNIDAVEFTGGVPFDILKPLLLKLNADQLFVLEHHNSYLIEDTDPLWQFHCKKDFRGESRMELESWRELYVRCMEAREKKLKALTENISKSMAQSAPVRQAKLAYVDTVAKPPRNIARKQAKYGTGSPVKQEIIKKAVVGAHTPAVTAREVVPPPPPPTRIAAQILKKKKAPLMAKALQLVKGSRFKR